MTRVSPPELARALPGPQASSSVTRVPRRSRYNAVHPPNAPAPTTTTCGFWSMETKPFSKGNAAAQVPRNDRRLIAVPRGRRAPPHAPRRARPRGALAPRDRRRHRGGRRRRPRAPITSAAHSPPPEQRTSSRQRRRTETSSGETWRSPAGNTRRDFATFLRLTSLCDAFGATTFAVPVEGYVQRMLWALAADSVIPHDACDDPWGPALPAGERDAVRAAVRAARAGRR